jgi:hypothetical protein
MEQVGQFLLHAVGSLAHNGLYPYSTIFGVSRGGLVGSLALAKAGAAWSALMDTHGTKFLTKILPLYRSVNLTPDLIAVSLQSPLGPAYGILPPASFAGIITLAAPSTITIGRYRVVLEQIVKGHGSNVFNPEIPCLGQLVAIFDDYRNDVGNNAAHSAELLADAVHKIHTRDVSFVFPLMMAALKNWKDVSGHHPKKASFYIVHHNRDKIVPVEQSEIAYSVLSTAEKDKFIRDITLSKFGLNVQYHALSDDPGESTSCHLDWKFKMNQPRVDGIIDEWYRSMF